MRKTPLRKIGKRGQDWINKRALLKKEFMLKGIIECELRLPGCWKDNALGFAHKEKRWKYISEPEKLGDFNEVVLACNPCHAKIENNRELTLEVFKRLR